MQGLYSRGTSTPPPRRAPVKGPGRVKRAGVFQCLKSVCVNCYYNPPPPLREWYLCFMCYICPLFRPHMLPKRFAVGGTSTVRAWPSPPRYHLEGGPGVTCSSRARRAHCRPDHGFPRECAAAVQYVLPSARAKVCSPINGLHISTSLPRWVGVSKKSGVSPFRLGSAHPLRCVESVSLIQEKAKYAICECVPLPKVCDMT